MTLPGSYPLMDFGFAPDASVDSPSGSHTVVAGVVLDFREAKVFQNRWNVVAEATSVALG